MTTKITREVLEMAAKAAGIEVFYDETLNRFYRIIGENDHADWTPHISGADTWKLMFKCGLIINPEGEVLFDYNGIVTTIEFIPNNPVAAAAAVVLAAAEIGRAMR